MPCKCGKMVIIGAGFVGSAVLNAVLRMNIANEIVLIDVNREKAEGEVLDASHTTAFAYSTNVDIRVGDYADCADAQLIVMTAGPSIKPGESSGAGDRMRLLTQNAKVMRAVMAEITAVTREAVLIIVTNPVDVLVHIAQSEFNYPREQVIGTGTLVDTARFNKILGDRCGVDAKNVTGFVLGEHGAHAFVHWDTVNIAGIPFQEFEQEFHLKERLDKAAIMEQVRSVGLRILELKGYTSAGVAISVCRIAAAIVHNERCVIPVCIALQGEYGHANVALSVPCIISARGIEQVLELKLDEPSRGALKQCADYLKKMIAEAG